MNTRIPPFELFPLYYQLVVYDSKTTDHWNDWRPAHVKQGFAWRYGIVSFGTLDTLMMSVEIVFSDHHALRPDVIRAIRVPFSITPQSQLGIAVVTEQRLFDVSAARYALIFEHGRCRAGDKLWSVLTFVPDDNAQASVLIADDELAPPVPLLMDAVPV